MDFQRAVERTNQRQVETHQDPSRRHERFTCDKLQAQKSSFQAWKASSLAFSLLVLVLLLAKWRELSSDLRLLQGLESLLESQEVNSTIPSSTVHLVGLAETLALVQLGSKSNETIDSNPRGASTDETLTRHMQVELSRELNGLQLLKFELDLFSG